jgi:hypothetical protein
MMETNILDTKAKVLESKEGKLKELHAQQEKLKKLQSELDIMESKIKSDEKLSREDVKFLGELGWLSAAAVTIASIASSI